MTTPDSTARSDSALGGWKRAKFLIATLTGTCETTGFVYRGLGLDKRGNWVLTHLNTGLKIARLGVTKSQAMKAATEVAEAGDWEFCGPDGIKNQFPDAGEKVHSILQKHGFAGIGPVSKLTQPMRDVCKQVLASREAKALGQSPTPQNHLQHKG